MTLHGHRRSRATQRTPTYNSWRGMKERCTNPNHEKYSEYGGRGIIVCERWMTFANFLEDMGKRPRYKTLDRINVNGNYEPSNCRWATVKQQNRNRRVIQWHRKNVASIQVT